MENTVEIIYKAIVLRCMNAAEQITNTRLSLNICRQLIRSILNGRLLDFLSGLKTSVHLRSNSLKK